MQGLQMRFFSPCEDAADVAKKSLALLLHLARARCQRTGKLLMQIGFYLLLPRD